MDDWKNGGFGLYVHWPFCVSKCPYCDFNSHVSSNVDQDAWERAFIAAIDYYATETPNRTLSSIYFGGGTPSLMNASLVGAIIDQAQKRWHFSNKIEITLEANPNSVESTRFNAYRQAGVNRVSLGVQALNDADLKYLGRLHSVSDALKALEIARNCFDRFSFDLIYARQNQNLDSWQQELNRALDLNPDHLALYQLTIEAGTPFSTRHAKGLLRGLPNEDLAVDLFEVTEELCKNKGLPAYEISNHAKPGNESRHNLIYWSAGDYVGIGPGAHGRITIDTDRFATETPLAPGEWLDLTGKNTNGESSRERLSGLDQASEYLIMGLRKASGISLKRFRKMGGKKIQSEKISDLHALGLLTANDDQISATAKGKLVLNGLIRELAPD